MKWVKPEFRVDQGRGQCDLLGLVPGPGQAILRHSDVRAMGGCLCAVDQAGEPHTNRDTQKGSLHSPVQSLWKFKTVDKTRFPTRHDGMPSTQAGTLSRGRQVAVCLRLAWSI